MKNYTVRIHMGAAAWTIETPSISVDLRKLNKDEQRATIFEVVKFARIRRELAAA